MFNSYIWILVWCAVAYWLMVSAGTTQMEYVNGKPEWRMKKVYAVIVFVPLLIMVTNRGWVGDTGVYYSGFFKSPTSFSALPAYIETLEKDKGFYTLTAVLRVLLKDNFRAYFFVLAAIQSYFLIMVYRKYSGNFALSFFLFIASTDYISWMYNGIRQFLAVTIAFGAFESILKGKYIKSLLILIVASFFHGTALLIIPFLFIGRGKAWNGKTILFMIGVVASILFVDRFTSLLDSLLQDTNYSNLITDITVGEFKDDDGTNPLRVLVYAAPTILAWMGRSTIRQSKDPVIHFCTNMSVISTGLYIISVATSGIMMGRLPIYFSLYNYILLPWELEHFFPREQKGLVYGIVILCYLAFYAYAMHFQFHLI